MIQNGLRKRNMAKKIFFNIVLKIEFEHLAHFNSLKLGVPIL